MSTKQSATASKTQQQSKQKPNPGTPEQPPLPMGELKWWDRLAGYFVRFDRFGGDILGVLAILLGTLLLLGFVGLTRGAFIQPVSTWLHVWLGWGSFVISSLMIVTGILYLRRNAGKNLRIRLGPILAVEGLFFCLLALSAIAGGLDIDRAQAGMDGGRVGWGLAAFVERLLPLPWGTIFLIVCSVIFGLSIFGLWSKFFRLLETWAQEGAGEADAELAVQEAGDASLAESVKAGETGQMEKAAMRRDERLPPLNLLTRADNAEPDERLIIETGQQIEQTLEEFGIPARVVGYRVGPTVTQYAVEPGYVEKIGPDGAPVLQKVRVAQISALSRDIALRLSAQRVRIEAPVPGKSYVGIELPNSHHSLVRLRPLLETEDFQKLSSSLAFVLGQNVSGMPVVADLARMPHMLIAGTTGSGKSVCIQALTTCLVMNNTPSDLRLAMLDPKMVELVRFNGLPHLLGKVEIEVDRMMGVLRWAINEMDARYRLLEMEHARDLDSYNRKMTRRGKEGLPRIVIMIDELADLMMTAPDQTETSLIRLAQMARATGIHLVVATQRPSTDVLTGLIKANFPARIAFTVASAVDSRVILDSNGAETLLGRGDMLFLNPEVGSPSRVQGVWVTDQEVQRVVDFWQKMSPQQDVQAPWEELLINQVDSEDSLVEEAIKVVKRSQRASASLLQRRLRIGYPRAARLIDQLEEMGIVGPSQGSGKDREVLIGLEDDPEDENISGESEE